MTGVAGVLALVLAETVAGRRGAHLDLSALERDEALVLHAVERARDAAVRVARLVRGVLGRRRRATPRAGG